MRTLVMRPRIRGGGSISVGSRMRSLSSTVMPLVFLVLISLAMSSPNSFIDRKSTRLNSSHLGISYAVFCLKKKKRRNCTIGDLLRFSIGDVLYLVCLER